MGRQQRHGAAIALAGGHGQNGVGPVPQPLEYCQGPGEQRFAVAAGTGAVFAAVALQNQLNPVAVGTGRQDCHRVAGGDAGNGADGSFRRHRLADRLEGRRDGFHDHGDRIDQGAVHVEDDQPHQSSGSISCTS